MEPALRRQALTHKTYANEHPGVPHNERLEWLGDAVLQFVVSKHLYAAHPHADEGELSRRRAALVSNEHLAAVCSADVKASVRTGRSAQDLTRCYAGVYEALLGAALLSGVDVIERVHTTLLNRPPPSCSNDPVSEVQEREQKITKRMPVYSYTEQGSGYVCEVVTWWGVFRGAGRGKKDARRAAALTALLSCGTE